MALPLKDAIRFRLRDLAALPGWYQGTRCECPCCGGRYRRMRDFRGRRDVRCPRCGSLERHRVLMLYLQRETEILSGANASVLHFAPESAIGDPLARAPGLHYETADLEPGRARNIMDMTDIPRDANSYDYVLVTHVLEHIPDDRKAMGELLRVLRPGGLAMLQHPVDYSRQQTYEDWSLTSPSDRRRAFMQDDHVRVYGSDLAERLTAVGFDVNVRRFREEVSPTERSYYRLDQGSRPDRSDDIYECRKPQSPHAVKENRPAHQS